MPTPPLPRALGWLLTGELSPLGPGVVDASKSEAPQSFIEQLPVPDSKAQEDAIDLVLSWRLRAGVKVKHAEPQPLTTAYLTLLSRPTTPPAETEQALCLNQKINWDDLVAFPKRLSRSL